METGELLIKRNDKPAKNLGKYPTDRTIEELFDKGAINLDKDAGPTSHIAADQLKRVLKIDKAGHSGTLDPAVTGVLLMGLGRATRLMEYMLKSNKEYVCLMYVHKPVSKQKIEEIFKKFTGKIMQTPPIVSAVKREEREREIYSIEFLDYADEGQNILFKVACQHGTYIRKLCSDMGDALGVGAQMKELRRTKAGPIREEDNIISLDKLRNLYELYLDEKDLKKKNLLEKELKKYIFPMEYLLQDFKKVYVREMAVNSLCHGADLAIPGVSKLEDGIEMGEEVVIMSLKGELIAIGIAFLNSDEVMKKNKGAFVKTSKVFMDIDYYPKSWDFEEKN